MGFSINLRGDLAKLSDGELADRLGSAWKAYDEADGKPKRLRLWYSRRGPVRHPWAYRVLSVAGLSGPGRFSHYFGMGPFLRWDACDMHLVLCEIRDLTEEIERRNARRTRHA